MESDELSKIPKELNKLIPLQYKGKRSDTYSSLVLNELTNPDIAYKSIRHRLLDVNNWALYATLTNADFILLDNGGKKLNRQVAEADFIKVRFSRLQNIISVKHDYVRVTQLTTIPTIYGDAVVMQVKPTFNPSILGGEVDHFFTAAASNTFVLYRDKSKIFLSIHGRNEQPNYKVSKTSKKVRNLVFAFLGILAVSKVQWKSLAHGLLNYNEKIL